MSENNASHHRKSIRLRGYDYTQAGAYFITLVTYQRTCLFGEWVVEEIKPSKLGNLIVSEWKRLQKRFLTVELDEWVIMPNHFHGIIVLSEPMGKGQIDKYPGNESFQAPHIVTEEKFGSPVKGSIPTIIRSFKSSVTQKAQWMGMKTPIWQRNYYEHVIWNEDEFDQTRLYIQDNPRRWLEDAENPSRPGRGMGI
jgi:putative transposase